jgi:hypothetical protein
MRIRSTPVQPPKSESPSIAQARKSLSTLAAAAVHDAIAAKAPSHPILERFGQALGLGLGVVVTEALGLSRGWSAPLRDASGKPVAHIDGATRIGDHDLEKRHQEVVGPQIAALVAKLPPGAVHDLLDGLAQGATAAPGTSYRFEAALADLLKR